jgi:clan AA aspartic protease (TIGR02281 family)
MTNKLKFIIYFFLISTFSSFAQKQIIIYTNENYETIEDKNVAKYYRILTYNKDNKSGLQKIYSIDGTLKFSGKYLSANLKEFFGDKLDEKWTWYDDNGVIRKTTNYINGEETGYEIIYDELGNILTKTSIYKGIRDEENREIFAHSEESYSSFRGQVLGDGIFSGEQNIYYKDGDTIRRFLKSTSLEMPAWSILTPGNKKEKKIAYFRDNFELNEKHNNWSYTSDNDAEVKFLDDELLINFFSKGFFRSVNLDAPPVSLNDYDFNISVVISKKSNAFGQGIEFGKLDSENLFRANLINNGSGKGILIFDKLIEGVFVEEKKIENIYYRNNEDNYLKIVKKGTTVSIIVNGYSVYQIENVNFIGDGISLVSGALDNRKVAYFKDFDTTIFLDEKISPLQVNVKKKDGVFMIPIELNSILKIDFVFDTGASDVSISPDIALTLIKAGTIKENDWLKGVYYKFADGSVAKSKRFKLKTLKIGELILNDVICSIANSIDAPLLLGQSVIQRLGNYTFDNQNNILYINSVSNLKTSNKKVKFIPVDNFLSKYYGSYCCKVTILKLKNNKFVKTLTRDGYIYFEKDFIGYSDNMKDCVKYMEEYDIAFVEGDENAIDLKNEVFNDLRDEFSYNSKRILIDYNFKKITIYSSDKKTARVFEIIEKLKK